MTPTRHKRGDVRPDGFRFAFYYRRRGNAHEEAAWLTPEAFKRWADQTRAAVTKWRAKQRARTEGMA